jgi:N-glycosidase YbiA
MESKPIHFYRTTGKYGCFSNFSLHPIEIDNVAWPTTEHYFQAQKLAELDVIEKVRKAKTPAAAKKMGRAGTMLCINVS